MHPSKYRCQEFWCITASCLTVIFNLSNTELKIQHAKTQFKFARDEKPLLTNLWLS